MVDSLGNHNREANCQDDLDNYLFNLSHHKIHRANIENRKLNVIHFIYMKWFLYNACN